MSDDRPRVFIQWKGTDACFDFYCGCGSQGHFDGSFAYFVRCAHCGAVHEMPSTLALVKLDRVPEGVAEQAVVEPEPDEPPSPRPRKS